MNSEPKNDTKNKIKWELKLQEGKINRDSTGNLNWDRHHMDMK